MQSEVEKLTHEEHILKLPDTYIGSVEKTNDNMWIYDENSMVKKNLNYIPGEYKIYDEIIVNAIDQHIRLKEKSKKDKNINLVKNIKVTIDEELNKITVYNDGDGIPIEIHPKEKIWTPELIFGHLLTSSNYNQKNKVKHVGGKNGYGAKLTNIFSKEFTIETIDAKNCKKYVQTFRDNMKIKDKPKITKNSSKPYTKISFIPDHSRFGCTKLNKDMIILMKKRVYDVAAFTDNSVNVYLNGNRIETKSFEKYIDLYIGSKSDSKRAFEIVNDRWEIGAALSPSLSFEQISMVNGINTSQGGKHVDYITNSLCKKLAEYIKKKRKIDIKTSYIKDNIIVFIKSTIDNPSFNSQIKEYLTTNMSNFGSKCEISDKFIDSLAKSGILEKAIELNSAKQDKDLKKTDGKKQSRIVGIPKLDDANWAGTKKSSECTLILTEGDSAKAMALAGLGVVGRDKYGVFPLRGKLLNVRDKNKEIKKKILQNTEINNLKKILGLQTGRDYIDTKETRYGRVCVLTDQDEDGSHIKGLVFNLFETLWPSLYRLPGFLTTILTPVIKASKGKNVNQFYCLSDYKKWKENNNTKGYQIKYYKGLGTSTSKEAKEYFKNFNLVNYTTNDEKDKESLYLAFGQDDNCSDMRKDWLNKYNSSVTLDYNSNNVSISDFVNKDLIHFSSSDNIRSLPHVIDGLKKSQRKVLFSAFKRNLKNEIRVAQFAGYVSEHSAYHHGEASLQGTIINLAQDFVGSNNINLFKPIGQFGTRIKGGKDSAQPRYIHTCLSDCAYKIFNKLDEPLLDYINDDGLLVEPEHYIPLLPMILVNGSQGIGTGWSTKIPCYNPKDIVYNIKCLMENKEMKEMIPWYKNFKGTINKLDKHTFLSKGKYTIMNEKVVITELPIGTWTDSYKEYLDSIILDSSNKTNKKCYLRSYKTYCTDVDVKFELNFIKELFVELKNNIDKLESILKITSKISNSNMVVFNNEGKITKFDCPNDIISYHFKTRIRYYQKRKSYLTKLFNKDINLLELKIRFIMDFINNDIKIIKMKKSMIIKQLQDRKYPSQAEIDNNSDNSDPNYDYLLKMPIYNLSLEKIEEFEKQLNSNKEKLENLNSKTYQELWMDDLNTMEEFSTKIIIKKKLIIN